MQSVSSFGLPDAPDRRRRSLLDCVHGVFVTPISSPRETGAPPAVGLRVAFENVASSVRGLEDHAGVEQILEQRAQSHRERNRVLTFQCDSVHNKYQELLARGIAFTPGAISVNWGFGAELRAPDGYPIRQPISSLRAQATFATGG